ncbi:MAG TPA: hypothetical protein VIM48_03035 [Chthoniobacterales bacterium]
MNSHRESHPIVLLVIAVSFILSGIPLFFVRKPFLVIHAAYGRVAPRGEVVDHYEAMLYGGFIILLGIAFLYVYVRVKSD